MRIVLEAIARFLRGSRVSRLLVSLGINPNHYWLLMDLFGQLSERGEMLDELGRNGVALQTVAWIYAIFSGILSILMVLSQPAVATYFWTFQGLTAFLFLSVLVSEAGNSLVNPVEGLILAHQPINGATYTAAKLTHLVWIVLYLAPGLNAVPAFGGLMLKEATWHYPLTHLLAAFTTGLVAAFLCCALYGWLMRFVPARRLKAAGQLAASMPFVVMMLQRPVGKWFTSLGILQWWSALAGMRWALGLAAGAGALAIVSIRIRSLSADYLIRASSMMRGGSTAGTELRRSLVGEIVARWMGGQPARAGFAFVSRLARRDYQC